MGQSSDLIEKTIKQLKINASIRMTSSVDIDGKIQEIPVGSRRRKNALMAFVAGRRFALLLYLVDPLYFLVREYYIIHSNWLLAAFYRLCGTSVF